MDWAEDMDTDLWAFAAGIERTGERGPRAFTWTSTHSTVIAAAYDSSTTDGINDAGLVGNLLYLAESDVGEPGDRPLLSVCAWTQYLLDTCATVAEAVKAMWSAPFAITTAVLPNGRPSSLHLAMSDATGDSAIFEYVAGVLTVHHGREHRVMTNSPVYDQQLAINAHWREIGGETMLPGTSRAADRYVRADCYLSTLPTDVDARAAVAGVLSVQRNAAKPIGMAEPGLDYPAGVVPHRGHRGRPSNHIGVLPLPLRPLPGRPTTHGEVSRGRSPSRRSCRDSGTGRGGLPEPRGRVGAVEAKKIVRAAHRPPTSDLLALLDAAHARLHTEPRDVALARDAVAAISAERIDDPRAADAMTISQLADALGVRTRRVRHWDAEGLVVPGRFHLRGARTYSPVDVRDARKTPDRRLN